MVDEQDWAAICDSEIFRNYLANELKKDAKKAEDRKQIIAEHLERKQLQAIEEEREMERLAFVLEQLDQFEDIIKNKPELFNKLRNAKEAILNNPELIQKTDKNFVRGIMMLNLDKEAADIVVSEE